MRILPIFLLLVSNLAFGHYESNKIEIVSIYDGDTITAAIEVYPRLFKRVSIRLYGIDTPESSWRAKCDKEKADSQKAKEWLTARLRDSEVTIGELRHGKFAGRILANVYADGVNLSEAAIEAGHARPYFGEKRSDWCK